ncbi:MAG: hypothetical protein NUW37_13505 [Planctomycetes bacterium]|nr:hypothetical protein [Planctomycetota bacterium]
MKSLKFALLIALFFGLSTSGCKKEPVDENATDDPDVVEVNGGGGAEGAQGSQSTDAPAAEVKVWREGKCVACNGSMDGKAELKATHNGVEYHFCNADEIPTFQADPEAMISRAEAAGH